MSVEFPLQSTPLSMHSLLVSRQERLRVRPPTPILNFFSTKNDLFECVFDENRFWRRAEQFSASGVGAALPKWRSSGISCAGAAAGQSRTVAPDLLAVMGRSWGRWKTFRTINFPHRGGLLQIK